MSTEKRAGQIHAQDALPIFQRGGQDSGTDWFFANLGSGMRDLITDLKWYEVEEEPSAFVRKAGKEPAGVVWREKCYNVAASHVSLVFPVLRRHESVTQ